MVSYYDRLLEAFCDNVNIFSAELGFSDPSIRKNIQLGSFGEIDLELRAGEDIALIEVKSHRGLMYKFTHKQFPRYREFRPDASIYLLTGDGETLDPLDFNLTNFYRP